MSDTPEVDATTNLSETFLLAKKLERDLARVTAERDALKGRVDYLTLEVDYFKSDATTFRSERDAMKEDAERYRWLRENVADWTGAWTDGTKEWYFHAKSINRGTTLDAAIDAAIAARKGEKP